MKTSFQRSIDSTLEYANFFDFPLTQSELYHWLITPSVTTKSEFSRSVSKLPSRTKNKILPTLTSARKQRKRLAQNKLASVKNIIKIISSIPTVKLIGITGSLAMDNAKKHDDIDLMVITNPHTLWFTRGLITAILFFTGKKRPPSSLDHHPDTICINLWLETNSLKVPNKKQNLYTAHEVLQVKPLFDRDQTYQSFLYSNSWVSKFLANAYHQQTTKKPSLSPFHYLSIPIAPFNLLAFALQYLYMKRKITREKITLHSAYFHPRDFSRQIDHFLKTKS